MDNYLLGRDIDIPSKVTFEENADNTVGHHKIVAGKAHWRRPSSVTPGLAVVAHDRGPMACNIGRNIDLDNMAHIAAHAVHGNVVAVGDILPVGAPHRCSP